MVRRPARLILASVAGLALAIALFLQASSSVLMLKQPALAARLMPLNGLALEQAATQQFMAGVKTEADIPLSARKALPMARRAFALDPLSPKSLAIMAMAEPDRVVRRTMLTKASAINRRDLLLQGLVLEEAVAAGDYRATLEVFDRILRVHPEQKAAFFPILTDALKNPAAAGELGALLEQDSTWHEQFLEFAAADKDALPNLARLRLSRTDADPKIDQRLVAGLVQGGNIALAHQIYAKATGTTSAPDGKATQRTDWSKDYPPFDWKLADDAGFRAQPAIASTSLDVFIRSGKGGVLAERLVATPPAGTVLKIAHTLTPASQVRDLRVQASCPGDETPALDQPLRIQPMQITLPALAGRCGFMRIAIYGRSWSGRSAIRGEITRFEIDRD